MIATESAPSHAEQQEKRRARRIVWQDAVAIADMVAKRMTEAEACETLDINPRHWYRYKERAGKRPKIDALLTRMRARQIKAHIENMEDAEHGRNGHRIDWRPSLELLRIKAPERFGQQQPAGLQVTVSVDDAKLKRIADIYHRTQQATLTDAAIDCQSLAAVPDQDPGDDPAGTTPDDWTDGTD